MIISMQKSKTNSSRIYLPSSSWLIKSKSFVRQKLWNLLLRMMNNKHNLELIVNNLLYYRRKCRFKLYLTLTNLDFIWHVIWFREIITFFQSVLLWLKMTISSYNNILLKEKNFQVSCLVWLATIVIVICLYAV